MHDYTFLQTSQILDWSCLLLLYCIIHPQFSLPWKGLSSFFILQFSAEINYLALSFLEPLIFSIFVNLSFLFFILVCPFDYFRVSEFAIEPCKDVRHDCIEDFCIKKSFHFGTLTPQLQRISHNICRYPTSTSLEPATLKVWKSFAKYLKSFIFLVGTLAITFDSNLKNFKLVYAVCLYKTYNPVPLDLCFMAVHNCVAYLRICALWPAWLISVNYLGAKSILVQEPLPCM